jgi:site-specific DNA recombinase
MSHINVLQLCPSVCIIILGDEMQTVAIYLRKSRADAEAEARGEGETLARHRTILLNFAQKNDLHVLKIYEEVVSGEYIYNRPALQELLQDVADLKYNSVLVMDLDRLGRGNMQEQGYILGTFSESETKIITLNKTYDLSDDADEMSTEILAFVARRELKASVARQQRGRKQSAAEGNYIGNIAPYGYNRHTLDDGSKTLKINEEEARLVKMMFDMYVNQRMGTGLISKKLEELGVATRNNRQWIIPTVRDILKNPVYIGKIKFGSRAEVKQRGSHKKSRPRAEEYQLSDGKHEPIIDEVTFKKAQDIFLRKARPRNPKPLSNPLAGLIQCGLCGNAMIRKPNTKQPAHLMCSNIHCITKSTRFSYVEHRVLKELANWLDQYKVEYTPTKKQTAMLELKKSQLAQLEDKLKETIEQINSIHEFLEKKIYTLDKFMERSSELDIRRKELDENIIKIKSDIEVELQREVAQKEIIPSVESVLKLYEYLESAADKNELLKTVIEKCIYRKEKHQRLDDFSFDIYAKFK